MRDSYNNEELEFAIRQKEREIERLKEDYAYFSKNKLTAREADNALRQITQVEVEIKALKGMLG